MRYLQTAINCSSDPIISLQSHKYLNYSVVFVYCGWYFTSCLYPFFTQPNQDESYSDWRMWDLDIYLNFAIANEVVFICYIVVTTIITVVAICKQFQFVRNLRRNYAFDINKFAFALHAVLMLA